MRRAVPLIALIALGCIGTDDEDDKLPRGQWPDLSEDEGQGGAGGPGDTGGQGLDSGISSDGGDDGGGDGGGDGGDDGGNQGDDFDSIAASCHPDVEGWRAAWSDFEEEVLALTNEARAQGQNCGSYGMYPAVGPVERDPYLTCSARYHSRWMAQTGTFDHYSYGGDLGDDPWERIASTGFPGSATGENIAAGYSSPAQVVAGWIDSDGHCANLMSGSSTLLGVGYYAGGSYGHYWTQNFGR